MPSPEPDIVEEEIPIDRTPTVQPLQFFNPGQDPLADKVNGDFRPMMERVDPRSDVVFVGTDFDQAVVDNSMTTAQLDSRDPTTHSHSEYDPEPAIQQLQEEAEKRQAGIAAAKPTTQEGQTKTE